MSCSGEVTSIEHDKTARRRNKRVGAPVGQVQQTLANPCEVEGPWSELANQPDDRAVGIEVIAPQAHLREGSEKGACDDVEGRRYSGREVHHHRLKHSIFTYLLVAGTDIRFVRNWVGHANIHNTTIYARFTTRAREERARRLFVNRQVV